MSFQFVIDRAEQLSLDRSRVVATSISRSGIARNVNRGSQPWRIEAKLPDGLRWTEIRPYITALESIDRSMPSTFQISSTGQRWLNGYLGAKPALTGITGTWTKGNMSFYVNPIAGFVGNLFRTGDYIQLGNAGKVYQVTADAASTTGNSILVNLHRNIVDDTATNGTILVAQNVTWTVLCTTFPKWTLFARDQVSWSGNFVFHEVIV